MYVCTQMPRRPIRLAKSVYVQLLLDDLDSDLEGRRVSLLSIFAISTRKRLLFHTIVAHHEELLYKQFIKKL
jgi:hypothetical protein